MSAACALSLLPPPKRPGAMLEMLHRAEAADRYRLALGRSHPRWGNGSLASVAMSLPRAPEPFHDEPDFLDCLMTVYAALKARNDRAARASPTRS